MLKTSSLTQLQYNVIINKATETPYSGEYTDTTIIGTYLCRNCGLSLFHADNKFHSGCGWPSFDLEIADHVKKQPDTDGRRTEIVCNRCNGHLGHVFYGEGFTKYNTRYCVNSVAIDFVESTEVADTEEIVLAAGCFWGVEYYLKQLDGIILTQVGYCGGSKDNPSYQEVCSKITGHLEVVRVIFDTTKLNLSQVIKYFFEIHDPTQQDGQGPDIGSQYLSAIFCYDQAQKDIAKQIIRELEDKGYNIATTTRDMATFWVGEEYHRDYYNKKQDTPYCHSYTKRF